MHKRAPIITLLISAWLLAGCSGTSITQSWVAPEFAGALPRRPLIIAVTDNDTTRRAFEDAFTEALGRHGIQSRASYRLLPDGALHEQAAITAAMTSSGSDSVLITRLLGVEQRDVHHPPSTQLVPSQVGGFYPYYRQSWVVIHEPAYTSSHHIVALETSLYDVDDQLVWSARTETWDAKSERRLMKEVIEAVVEKLNRDGLLDE
jgi:molybdopterin biosynthesis enzyme MoaB